MYDDVTFGLLLVSLLRHVLSLQNVFSSSYFMSRHGCLFYDNSKRTHSMIREHILCFMSRHGKVHGCLSQQASGFGQGAQLCENAPFGFAAQAPGPADAPRGCVARRCSLVIENVLSLQNVFSHIEWILLDRMCSLTIECVLLP